MSTNDLLRLLIISQIVIFSTSTSQAQAVRCPQNCKCSWVLDSLEVDCSYSGLLSYPNFSDLPIEQLNLSHNHFVEFPTNELKDLQTLTQLDLSSNKISYLDANALSGFTSLRTLLLANNSITNWLDINPSVTFTNAIGLKRLSLSGNALGSFEETLASNTLIELELESCGISTIGGNVLTNGLPVLERLSLSGNRISSLTALPSDTLRKLELRGCELKEIKEIFFDGLPSLEILDLSHNTALQIGTKAENTIYSTSLTSLDVSFCNLYGINLSGLPALDTLRMRGNMLRAVTTKTFAANEQLEIIDFAHNSIRNLEPNAFNKLKRLTKLDLSYNELARLDANIFRTNELLVSLNLSRNVLERFSRIMSNSLREIDLSWNEIFVIETNALTGLSAIQRLDLSNNLLRDFPAGMGSPTLQKLSLSECKLSHVRNNTFCDYPELASLRLNGNRFTNPFSSEYFRSNKYLDEIWLADNPWICNCLDTTFVDFYDYLTSKPQKLKDKWNTRCASPQLYFGKTWEAACYRVWQPDMATSNGEKVWYGFLICALLIGGGFFLVSCLRKYMKHRKEREDTREARENQDEMESLRRFNQRMLEESGTPNAPNIYANVLPTYEDALLMPKVVPPSKSMVDLTANLRATRKKRSSSRTDADEIITEDNDLLLDHRQRFRSEEMLSNRDKERVEQIVPQRRVGFVAYQSSSRRLSIESGRGAPSQLRQQNMQSAEKIANFQSYEHSPYTKRKPKIAEIPPFRRATLKTDSVEFLTDPEYEEQSKPGSPFARRKPKLPSPDLTIARLDPAIENYFSEARDSKSLSSQGSDFQLVVEPELASLPENDLSTGDEMDLELGRRTKRKNSSSRRASGNFTTAAAAAADTSSSEREAIVVVHKPMRETLF